MPLDHIAFQDQGFQLRPCDDRLDIPHLAEHDRDFGRVIAASLEIGPDPIGQHGRLADVEDLAPGALHHVHTRLFRNMVELGLQLSGKMGIHSHHSSTCTAGFR